MMSQFLPLTDIRVTNDVQFQKDIVRLIVRGHVQFRIGRAVLELECFRIERVRRLRVPISTFEFRVLKALLRTVDPQPEVHGSFVVVHSTSQERRDTDRLRRGGDDHVDGEGHRLQRVEPVRPEQERNDLRTDEMHERRRP